MVVERVLAITPEIVEAFRRLVPQLTRNNPAPERADLEALVRTSTNVLLVARQPDQAGTIVGSGSVSSYRVPTGVRAIIEDVVVDEAARGQGIGEALMSGLLEAARDMGAAGVSLTSNPARIAANRLYVRMGFTLRRTNCYYYKFPR
jgi:ribosomal protein S18 acetylase RimI-like enzyme